MSGDPISDPGERDESPPISGEAPRRPGIIDAAADFLQTAADWLRQEAGDIVRERVILPIQKLGLTLAAASAAGCLAVLGLAFVAVALFMYLGTAIGYPGALLLVGGVLLAGSVAFTVMKMRNIQR